MTREQRTAERAPIVVAVDVWSGRQKRLVLARDASRGGLCLAGGDVGEPGGYVTIGVRLDDGARFTAVCRVAWTDARRTGVELVDVDPAARAFLAAKVASKAVSPS